MSSTSPYAVPESEPPKWKPGEDLAASAFLGVTLFLIIDINVCILRTFKKRNGLYYWSMMGGAWACLLDALGVILKYLTPNATRVWGLYTFILLTGWSIYAPAQLLVLYSRLHLVNENRRTQRWVLIVIVSTLFLFILPTWLVVWPAYDPDPKVPLGGHLGTPLWNGTISWASPLSSSSLAESTYGRCLGYCITNPVSDNEESCWT